MIRLIADNLTARGYTLDGEAEDDWAVFTHKERTPTLIKEYEPNIIGFMSRYKINDRFKTEEKKILQILNKLNIESVIAKYELIINHDYRLNQIAIRATWLPFYAEEVFTGFLYNWQYDNEKRILAFPGVEDYLLLTKKAQIVA